jgi:hypothetical protein
LRAAMGEARLQNNIAGIENQMVTHGLPPRDIKFSNV